MIDGKNLIIVAHPDDELLFAYSELVNRNWYVLCVTNGDNDVRSFEFKNVMDSLGLENEMLCYKDEWGGDFEATDVSDKISSVLSRGFDNVMTHDEKGEYGHRQHQELHTIVKGLVDKNLYVFGEYLLPLDFNVLKDKMNFLSLYDSQCKLNAWDWYDQNDRTNNLMKYVVSEGHTRIK